MALDDDAEAPGPSGTVREGDHVILDVNGGERLVLTQVMRKTRAKLGKGYCPLLPLVGASYGSIFELSVDGKALVPGSRQALESLNQTATGITGGKNNAQLFDDGTAQSLSKDAIEKLKEEGLQGNAIIDKLCENSATFSAKTEFSQEKYKRKKRKKYCTLVMVCRPCVRSVCEAYFQKSPQRVCGLRVDTVGLMLGMANVAAHSSVLILEESGGLMLASSLERQGGFGRLCATSIGAKPPMDIVRFLNFDERITANARHVPLSTLLALKYRALQPPPFSTPDPLQAPAAELGEGQSGGQQPEDIPPAASPQAAATQGEGDPSDGEAERPPKSRKLDAGGGAGEALGQSRGEPVRRRVHFPKRGSPDDALVGAMVASGFDSVVLVAPSVPVTPLVRSVLPLMAPSASFVVYSPYLQPLFDCRMALQRDKRAVQLSLTETFWREHQVLPGRSHPFMNMTTGPSSSYVLSGTAAAEGEGAPEGGGGGVGEEALDQLKGVLGWAQRARAPFLRLGAKDGEAVAFAEEVLRGAEGGKGREEKGREGEGQEQPPPAEAVGAV